jgi:hypothetical protein
MIIKDLWCMIVLGWNRISWIILRTSKNVFGEYEKDQYVCTTKGYYHKGGTYITNFTNDGANLNRNYEDRLLFILDDEVKKIKDHDYFKLDR